MHLGLDQNGNQQKKHHDKNITKFGRRFNGTIRHRSLGVTEQRDPPQDPMVGILARTEQQREDVRQVSASRLLVDGALVDSCTLASLGVDGEHVYDG